MLKYSFPPQCPYLSSRDLIAGSSLAAGLGRTRLGTAVKPRYDIGVENT